MSDSKQTVVEALTAAGKQRDRIYAIITETNQFANLSSAYYSFGEALETAKEYFTDSELMELLVLIETDENGTLRYDGDNDILSGLFSEAQDLKATASRAGVRVSFAEMFDVCYEDVEYISSWSSSSLSC